MSGHRQLLPATVPPPPPPDGHRIPRRKRQMVDVACNTCRSRKLACDGSRPTCAYCGRQGLSCSYVERLSRDELQRRIENLQREVTRYRNVYGPLPRDAELEASEALFHLRNTTRSSPTQQQQQVPPMMTGADPTLRRPSEIQSKRAVLPPAQSGLQTELQLLHSFAYPPLEPLTPGSIQVASWFSSARRSPVHGVADPPDTLGRGGNHDGSITVDTSSLRSLETAPTRATTTSLLRDWQHCDARLRQVRMNYWSKIPIDDEFSSCALSHFFMVHYPVFACFDADLFLEDLVEKRQDHCSEFLVHSIMTLACQSFTTFEVRASAFAVMFEQGAKVLWQAERSNDRPINLAAMCYLAMATGMSGNEAAAVALLTDIRAMVARMNLFGTSPSREVLEEFHKLPPADFRAMAAAAWGAYSWLTFHATHYPAPPIAFPPAFPIPGDAKRRNSGLDWPPHPLPTFAGQTVTNLCQLWPIVQEIEHFYSLSSKVPLARRVTLSVAEGQYRKLLAWSAEVNVGMNRSEDSDSHVFVFHALFHMTVTRLFQPFLDSSGETRLYSFSSRDSHPATIHAASMRQLKRLVVWYRTRARQHSDNGWFTAAILEVMAAVLRDTQDPDRWIYFQLCHEYCKEAYVRYRVYLQVVKAVYAHAIDMRAIDSNTAAAMIEDLRAVGTHHEAPETAFLTAIVNYDMATRDLEKSRMDIIASNFPHLLASQSADSSNRDDDGSSAANIQGEPS